MKTPVTPSALEKYDRWPAADAVRLAWGEAGPRTAWHAAAKAQVRECMPLLARALDRLVAGK